VSSWILPEGISDLTGDSALLVENNRRSLLDLYKSLGYEFVIPPIIENIESLLLTSKEVDKKTFKFLDPTSGDLIAVHSDITPQIARIDAMRSTDEVEKYCYVNSIVQTQVDDFYASRSPIQVGAELYGDNSYKADIEIIDLMLKSLESMKLNNLIVNIGNVKIFNLLAKKVNLDEDDLKQLSLIFARRSKPDLADFVKKSSKDLSLFSTLINLEGDSSVLTLAIEYFKDDKDIINCIKEIQEIGKYFEDKDYKVMYDLAELKTYGYHTGLIFSVFNDTFKKVIANGGRYNGIGKVFGMERPATGFSFDLKYLSQV